MKIQLVIVILAISLSQSGCKAILDLVKVERGEWISSKHSYSYSLSTMRSALINSKYTARYGVKTYKLIYETVGIKGKYLQASGLIAIPQKNNGQKSPLLMHHHGMITKNKRAPSFSSKPTDILSKAASLGYIVIAPDYIGYGESSDDNHPFLHNKTLASASIDMLRATKKWLKKNGYKVNGQLFLEGYGEGGYATMAVHRTLEKDFSKQFKVTASAPAAGAYDLSRTVPKILEDNSLASPATIGFLIKAYDELYDSKLINSAIAPNYNNIVNKFINNGAYDTGEIDMLLGKQADRFMRASFLSDIRSGYEAHLTGHLAKNNIYNWKPNAPIRIIHGEDDEVIPYANAVTAIDKMIANGATDIQLVKCDVSPFTSKHSICTPFSHDYALSFFFGFVRDL